MTYTIIANPIAGKGACEAAIPRVVEFFKDAGLAFDLLRTEHPQHAVDLARRAAESGSDVVVAMGGDGTVNEVINGLMLSSGEKKPGCALGVLCVGRGNDFSYGVGIEHDLEVGCRALVERKTRSIDVGKVYVDDAPQPRYFGNGIGIGFDAVVGFVAAKMRIGGFPAYLIAALKTLFIYYQPPRVRIRFNGNDGTQLALMISVMNGRRMGGGFMMAPDALPDDGRLDLCIAGMARRLRILGLMVDFMGGKQAGKEPIRTGRTEQVLVEAEEGVLPAHADGETLCEEGKSLRAEILPNRLEVIVPWHEER